MKLTLKIIRMQQNENATNVINLLINNFGEDQVQTCDGGIIKLQIKELADRDLVVVSNILKFAHVRVKRSDKSLLMLFIPKQESRPISQETIDAIDTIKGGDLEDYDNRHPVSKLDEFANVVQPVIDYLKFNHHPHMVVNVYCTGAELFEGQLACQDKKK